MYARIQAAYAQLTPSEDVVAPAVRQWVAKALRPRRVRRMLRLIVLLALVAGAIWAGFHFQLW